MSITIRDANNPRRQDGGRLSGIPGLCLFSLANFEDCIGNEGEMFSIISGIARTQSPHSEIVPPRFPLGEFAGVNPSVVQCKGLTLGNPSA